MATDIERRRRQRAGRKRLAKRQRVKVRTAAQADCRTRAAISGLKAASMAYNAALTALAGLQQEKKI